MDEMEFVFRASDFNKKYSTRRIAKRSYEKSIHGCDANDAENPMNWKWGGRYKRENGLMKFSPTREERAWPAPKEARGVVWWVVSFGLFRLCY